MAPKGSGKTAGVLATLAKSEHRGNRYGRSEEAREAVLQAADNLLAEVGFAALTIEGIAARAGVGKQTIYRWWPSKTDVLLDAFLGDAFDVPVPQDGGDLERELRAQLRQLAKFLTQTDTGAVFRALAGEAQHDEKLAARLRSDYLARQRTMDRIPLERAQQRGDLPKELDIDFSIDQLTGPIYYRVLVTAESVTPKFTDALVRSFIRQHEN